MSLLTLSSHNESYSKGKSFAAILTLCESSLCIYGCISPGIYLSKYICSTESISYILLILFVHQDAKVCVLWDAKVLSSKHLLACKQTFTSRHLFRIQNIHLVNNNKHVVYQPCTITLYLLCCLLANKYYFFNKFKSFFSFLCYISKAQLNLKLLKL